MTMRQIIFAILVSLLSVTEVLNGMPTTQHRGKREPGPRDNKDGLQLSIELDGEHFGINDVPTLKITLKNISQVPIAIYKNLAWGRSSSLTLSIVDDHEKMVRGTTLADASHVPPFPREDFLTIGPGESVQKESILGLRDEGIKGLGAYKLVVWYHSPIPRDFAPSGLNLWAMENGVLQSKPVTLKVTP